MSDKIQSDEVALSDSYKQLMDHIKRNTDPYSNTVLLVDDERGIRKKVARDIGTFAPDVVVFEAANGAEALEKLLEIRLRFKRDPVLMVLDLNMPIMDGWAVIKHLKEEYESQGKPAGIPIVVLSSTSGEKGRFFSKQSVHDGHSGYTPLVAIAKEACIDKSRYDGAGEKSLLAWLGHFVK